MCAYFISADWSKEPTKRSVYVADIDRRSICKASTTGVWNSENIVGAREFSSAKRPRADWSRRRVRRFEWILAYGS